MSVYPPPQSPFLRRRNSTTLARPPHPPLDARLPTSLCSPNSCHFVEVPIVEQVARSDADAPRLQVPLTPSSRFLQEYARFGPRSARVSSIPEEVVPESKTAPVKRWSEAAKIWCLDQGPRWVWIAVWILIQLSVFAVGAAKYLLRDNFATARSTFGPTFVIARSAALVLHVDVAFILFPICRGFVSWLRRTRLNVIVPFEKNVEFHKIVAWSIVFWTLVHIGAHLNNFWSLAVVLSPSSLAPQRALAFLKVNFTTGPGATGWIMVVLLGGMCYFALDRERRKNFERFQWSHMLFLPFFAGWQLHGMFCMIKPDRPPFCSWNVIGVVWRYLAVPLVVLFFERSLREYRALQRTWITTVIQHPSRVVEIQFKREGMNVVAGQYVLLNCPELSLMQWHPFSVTSAPEEEFVSVHIREVGDFTRALAAILGCTGDAADDVNDGARVVPFSFSRVLPRIMIDGPFGSASEDVLKFEVSVLIGAGIGVTPFSSVLKHIWYQLNARSSSRARRTPSKVYFFWICRDFTSFKWFQSLLLALESQDTSGLIEIHTYLTSALGLDEVTNIMTNSVSSPHDAVTRLRAPTHYGRPNFHRLLSGIAASHKEVQEAGVFFCGPKPMGDDLEAVCRRVSRAGSQGTRFVWRKENF